MNCSNPEADLLFQPLLPVVDDIVRIREELPPTTMATMDNNSSTADFEEEGEEQIKQRNMRMVDIQSDSTGHVVAYHSPKMFDKVSSESSSEYSMCKAPSLPVSTVLTDISTPADEHIPEHVGCDSTSCGKCVTPVHFSSAQATCTSVTPISSCLLCVQPSILSPTPLSKEHLPVSSSGVGMYTFMSSEQQGAHQPSYSTKLLTVTSSTCTVPHPTHSSEHLRTSNSCRTYRPFSGGIGSKRSIVGIGRGLSHGHPHGYIHPA